MYEKEYVKSVYLFGDYTPSLDAEKNKLSCQGKSDYNFNGANCSNVSFGLLAESNTSAKHAAEQASRGLMPNKTFNIFCAEAISRPLSQSDIYFGGGGKYVM